VLRGSWKPLLLALALVACTRTPEPLPAPFAMTDEAVGHYCGMNLGEHAGPKGQIIRASTPIPVWFSSVRDTIAFTFLDEEPKDIRAIYVSDMGQAPNWDDPGADNWIEARQAWFVLGSQRSGGMGEDEAVPFADLEDAKAFLREHGGHILRFAEIPRDYVLGGADNASTPAEGAS